MNAEIKSIEEARKRLEAGEEFFLTSHRIHFDFSFALKGESPYRFEDSPLLGCWENFADWEIKPDWRDNIGKGKLCWVSNNMKVPDSTCPLHVILSYDRSSEYPYIAVSYVNWKYATPLTEKVAMGLVVK